MKFRVDLFSFFEKNSEIKDFISSQKFLSMDSVVQNTFGVRELIGKGSFGEVYRGDHLVRREPVAIKLEHVDSKQKQLEREAKIYSRLGQSIGLPHIYWSGKEEDYNILVMELLGKSLEQLLVEMKHPFSLKTVLMIADQMLNIIQFVHEKNYIHRDIKPANFLMGRGNKSNELYLIDFGLSKKYQSAKDLTPHKYSEGHDLIGTARYVSINTHMGIEQSRRDDMESIGYVLLYLLKGKLPWQGIPCDDIRKKFDLIADSKLTTSFDALCEGLPKEFISYFMIVRGLGFTDRPPYTQLRQSFRKLFIKLGFTYDYKYDWIKSEPPRRKNSLSVKIHAPLFKNEEIGLEKEIPNYWISRPSSSLIDVARGKRICNTPLNTKKKYRAQAILTPNTDSTLIVSGRRL